MIRSRDLFLFICIVCMLCIGIAYTVLHDRRSVNTNAISEFDLSSNASTSYSAVTDQKAIDRQQNIDRLREALKNSEVITKANNEDVSPTVSTEASTTVSLPTSDGIMKCGGDDASTYIHKWPLAGVSVDEDQGLRVVSYNVGASSTVSNSNASSTKAEKTAKTILIEMPLLPQSLSQPHCVPSDAIGVTTSGSLISNADATFYRGYGADFLIGYARDGYPIYGYYQGELDRCGGYTAQDGYRYAVSPSRAYIIGCYTAQPSPFVGL